MKAPCRYRPSEPHACVMEHLSAVTRRHYAEIHEIVSTTAVSKAYGASAYRNLRRPTDHVRSLGARCAFYPTGGGAIPMGPAPCYAPPAPKNTWGCGSDPRAGGTEAIAITPKAAMQTQQDDDYRLPIVPEIGRNVIGLNVMPIFGCYFSADLTNPILHKHLKFFTNSLDPRQRYFGICVTINVVDGYFFLQRFLYGHH